MIIQEFATNAICLSGGHGVVLLVFKSLENSLVRKANFSKTIPTYYSCIREHSWRTDYCLRCVLLNSRLKTNGFHVADPCVELPPLMFRINNVEREDYKDFLFAIVSKLRRHHRSADYRDQERQLLASIKYGMEPWLADLKSRRGKYV